MFANGDIAHPGTPDIPNTLEHAMKTSDIVIANKAAGDIVLALGDLAYFAGTTEQFNTYYHPTWGRLKTITYPCPGNHEETLTGYKAYWQSESARFPTSPASYYFIKNNWMFISIWTGSGDGVFQTTDYSLVDRALAARPASVNGLIAYWHHPRFTTGSRGAWIGADAMVKKLTDAGMDILLTAHDHHYERFAKIDAAANTVANNATKGFVNFVIGTGGSGGRGVSSTPAKGSVKIIKNDYRGTATFNLGATNWSMRWDPIAAHAAAGTDASPVYPINPK
jgi:hypothetical protein